MKFDWDSEKNKSNNRKHGIDFREAKTVFQDIRAIEIYDEEHSINEDRYIIIGMSRKDREVMVCHCYRNGGNVIRIFSARKATVSEKELYERGR
ncbi:MAG: BrnT family toxin [Defluviitaleaceae bacterium]|nr:BrnT family toxin [Defluviitaleaceae bacterium]